MDIFDIVVDAQGDFMRPDGKLYVPGAEAIIPAIQEHVATLTSKGVLFTFDTHFRGAYEHSEEAKEFPEHCIKDTPGFQLVVDPLTVPSNVLIWIMEKGVFDMWKEPGLQIAGLDRDDFFDELKANGVTKIRFSGVAADYCVKWAMEGAVARGFEVEVIGRLTVGIHRSIEQVVAEDFAGQAVTIV